MAKRSAPKPKVNMNDPAVKAILATLLADFRRRNLTVSDLQEGYEGPVPAEMRTQCCTTQDYSEVDYDLAFESLIEAEYIQTGPMKLHDNDPNFAFVIVAFYSESKYTNLTQIGYQEASRARLPRPPAATAQHVHISGGTFHHSPIGVGHGVQQTINLNTATTPELIARLREEVKVQVADANKQQHILDKLDDMEAATDRPTLMERYLQVVGAVSDHITVLGFLLTPLMQSLQHHQF